MTLRELIAGLDEDLLDIKVVVKVVSSSGSYFQTVGITEVQKDLKKEYVDGMIELDVPHSSIILHTTPRP